MAFAGKRIVRIDSAAVKTRTGHPYANQTCRGNELIQCQ